MTTHQECMKNIAERDGQKNKWGLSTGIWRNISVKLGNEIANGTASIPTRLTSAMPAFEEPAPAIPTTQSLMQIMTLPRRSTVHTFPVVCILSKNNESVFMCSRYVPYATGVFKANTRHSGMDDVLGHPPTRSYRPTQADTTL